MAGRKPKPTLLKQLEGNPGRRPLNLREPKPEIGIPDMPNWLAESAQREWREIIPILAGMKILTKADGKALAAYCETYAMWERAAEEIRRNGITFTEYAQAKSGELIPISIKKNPAVTVAESAVKIMHSFLNDFGLSPASRAKLKTSDGETQDPLQTFLDRKPATQSTQ